MSAIDRCRGRKAPPLSQIAFIAVAALFAGLFVAVSPACAAVTERSVYYSYDIMGRQLSAKFDSATGADGITNSYNGFGDLKSSTISMAAFARAVTASYDTGGRRTQVIIPGVTLNYAYDDLGRMSSLSQGTTLLDSVTYTTAGLPDTRSEGATGASSATYGWDDVGRLTSQSDAFAGTTGNVARSFAFNPASQMTSETRDNDSYAWTGAVNVNRAYAVNGLNQYTSAGPASFTYDANGNLTADGTSSYTYDVENRLVSATTGGVTATLTYDPLGRLYQVVKGTANTRFLYDGDALVLEYNSAGAVTNRYVHGSNAAADDPLVWYSGSGLTAKRWLHADHLGSIVGVTDATGAIQYTNSYDEYGIPGAANQGRFQYTGQAWLSELGLYYYKARIYSPTLGRFLQTDPVGYKGGVNLYGYVDGDPVNKTDPTGLDTIIELMARPLDDFLGSFGYQHQYVYLKDTDTGAEFISRAGPSADDAVGFSAAVSDVPTKDQAGNQNTLVTQLRSVSESAETNPKTGKPIGTVVEGSQIRLKGPIAGALRVVQKFNNSVDRARIPYRPLSTNSNAYAGTAYRNLTGRPPPTSYNRPGSDLNINRDVGFCRGTRIGNQGTGSIC